MAVTNSTLSIAQWPSWDVLNQFAEHLWSLLPTGGIGGDVSIAGQVQNGRKQTLKQVTISISVLRQAKCRNGYKADLWICRVSKLASSLEAQIAEKYNGNGLFCEEIIMAI